MSLETGSALPRAQLASLAPDLTLLWTRSLSAALPVVCSWGWRLESGGAPCKLAGLLTSCVASGHSLRP